ncbi:MAG TPA: hypothetical protein VJX68_07575 [Candidatus Binatus sp.]|uniref:hypothetical protein n=1 Tax=Candidatus Binatus sp. TaxID=2811406 RepID=UPI002B4591AC|nr:hypothetical protein [Candidatus Binatus sp.]HKN13042.1 hypothetical protein [Candidatus Binatus sp.]
MSTITTIGVADPRPFPDVILRSQFFEMVGTRALSSEQRLMLAVLADAINVVQEFGGSSSLRKRNSFNEAWNWFFSNRVSSPLSFVSVCDALGIDTDGLRWRLSELVAGRGGSPLRLRLKEASRMQRLTVNRVRRREPRRMHRAR